MLCSTLLSFPVECFPSACGTFLSLPPWRAHVRQDPERGLELRGVYRFRPHERLHSFSEYHRVKRLGKRTRTRHFGLNFAENGLSHHRLGVVVQKRFWRAVERNRIKRCLREWFRLNKSSIPLPGRDIVVIARPGAEKLSAIAMAKELVAALLSIG